MFNEYQSPQPRCLNNRNDRGYQSPDIMSVKNDNVTRVLNKQIVNSRPFQRKN